MQYHYMLMYDDATKMWSIDNDTLRSVMTDGTVYDRDVFPGWSWPEEGSPEEELDWELYQVLQSIVSTIPIPQEV
jgi:hypothetical protein